MDARQSHLRGCLAAPLVAVEDILNSGSRIIRRDGRRFLLTEEDAANGRLVLRLANERRRARTEGLSPPKLIAFREDFRRIARRGRIAGLFPCIDSHDPEALRLAIWLMAQTHGQIAIREIAPCRGSRDVGVRRDTARALKRLSAWAELRVMAEHDPDPQVRQLATPRSPRPFAERWEGMSRDLATVAAPRRPMRFFARQPIGPGRMPKTPEIVRAILERIRRMVHGR